MSHPYSLPPLPARPLPKLPEMTVFIGEHHDAVFSTYAPSSAEVLQRDMRLEIERRFEEALKQCD